MSLAELKELERLWAMPVYARLPVELVRGEGVWLFDDEGKRYLDFFSAFSVHNCGHCHPRIVKAIREQAGRLLGVSAVYYTEPALRLCERLARSSLGGKVFLGNSGAEANELAIKLTRRHAHARGVDEPEIVVLEGAFHGRTLGALAATPKLAREDLFGPLPRGFKPVPPDDADALRAAVGGRTAAVMIEPIQGEAGIVPIRDEVLVAAREACDEQGAVLVFDEVQAGMGRTGSLWAYEQTPVRPDLMCVSKALGGGVPIGACITNPELGDVLGPGEHGSTFSGQSLGAAAALAALDIIDDPELLRSVRVLGSRLCDGLRAMDGIVEVRGRGLMVAAVLAEGIDAEEVSARARAEGLLINVPAPSTVRMLPPLIVDESHVDQALEMLGRAVSP